MCLDQRFLLPQISKDLTYRYEDFKLGHDTRHLVNSDQSFQEQAYKILDFN